MGDKQITVPLNMVKQVLLVVTPENHIDYKWPYCHLPKIMEITWTHMHSNLPLASITKVHFLDPKYAGPSHSAPFESILPPQNC